MQSTTPASRQLLHHAMIVIPVVLALAVATISRAQPAPTAATTAAPSAAPTTAPEPSEAVRALQLQAQQVRDLCAKSLAIDVDPRDLFDIDITDAAAVAIEARRLGAIIEQADRDVAQAAAPPPDAGQPPRRPARAPEPAASAGAPSPPASGSTPMEYQALRQTDPARWAARIELDRARLGFYALAPDARNALLAAHETRQQADANAKAERELSEAERKADEAEKERQRVLEAARDARSEAVRLAIEEHARLLTVRKEQADYEAELVKREQAIKVAQEQALALQRKVREMVQASPTTDADRDAVDALYDEVRAVLREQRASLAEAITDASREQSDVPGVGEDRLESLPAEVDRSEPERVRKVVLASENKLREREHLFRQQRAQALYADVDALGKSRLALVPYLSPDKRAAVTGFGTAGLDQAIYEVRHTWLVLRYHFYATTTWLSSLQQPGAERGRSAIAATIVAFKWLFPIALFVWWRRRAKRTIDSSLERIRAAQKRTGVRRGAPSRLERLVRFVQRVRKPLEWLLLLWAVVWLLPAEANDLLEVELITTIFGWTLGGTLVVNSVDFLAGRVESPYRQRKSQLQTAHLRLRSLGLIGRVVVVFGLILALSNKLVGEGTIYTWVFRLCWFAAIPVFLVILRWWRDVIFERVELRRKKNALGRWVVANQAGWKSFLAAVVGAVILLAVGTLRFGRAWVSTFDLTRRLLAYLFRRGMDKKAEQQSQIPYERIDAETFAKLGPATPSKTIVPSIADHQVDDVIARINAPGGGVFAVVGERGAGKTTLLERIAEQAKDVSMVDCPFGGMAAFAPRLLDVLGAAEDASLEQITAAFDAEQRDAGVLIDNAHRLIQPMMGGLEAFDRLLTIARTHSQTVTWVLAIDDMIWRFLERMRGAKPLFDDVIRIKPWREEAIARLLTERSREADIHPVFASLLGELPADADEIDREEALQQTEASYYRLIWDYASGNPGVALHVWRRSLGLSEDGEVTVKLFQAPDTVELEQLPDPAVFVLRAVVQLENADSAAICRATRLPHDEVENALRYGLVRGYFRQAGGAYRITWAWFRAITRFLQRRHLLFASG